MNFIRLCAEHAIPCDSFQLSSGYTSIGHKRYVFNWNHGKIPDPQGMAQAFRDAGIRLAANIKPCLQQAENAEAAAQKNWQHAHSARIQAERDTAHSENTRNQLHARQNEYTHTLAHGIQQWQVTDGDLPAALAACEAHGSALAERIRALHDIQRQREQADNILRARDWCQ